MWGAIASIGASLGSSLLNNYFADERQDDQQAFNAKQFASRYQTTVADMSKAGLNPALAYQQGGGNAPSSGIASAASSQDLGASFNQGRMASAQVANIQADTENKAAQAKLIEAQAAQAWASAGQSEATTGRIGFEVDKIKQETENLKTDEQRIRYTIQQLAESASLMAQQGETQVSIREQLRAAVSKLQSETKLLDLDFDAAMSLGNLGREAGQLKPLVDVLRALLRK